MTSGQALFALTCILAAIAAFVGAIIYRRRGDLFSWAFLLSVALCFAASSWLVVTL